MVDFVKFKKNSDDKSDKPSRQKKMKFSFKRMLLVFLAFLIISSMISSLSYSLSPKVAVIPINGVIQTSSSDSLFGSSVNSRDIAEKLYAIKDDSTIKAVILDINSPGGSPVASEEISKAIEAVKEADIPVYSVISDLGASGAFWIAVSTDKIYASSMSTVGSIGVTSAGLSFENFIKNYNITYRKQTAGEYKDMGSIFRNPTDIEQEKIQKILDEVHVNFIKHVAEGRNLDYDYVKNLATGEIFLGSYAKEKGLIDEIGYYPDVVKDIKGLVGDKVTIVDYGPKPTFLQELGLTSMKAGILSTQSKILLQ